MRSEPEHENDRYESSPLPAEDEAFLAGSGRRMYRDMWVLAIVGVAACWLWRGWRWAGGFGAGAALSALNFHWLHRAVASVTNMFQTDPTKAPQSHKPAAPGPVGSAFRIALRYALIGVAAYAIFKSSFVSLDAFFIGLFLFLGAVLVEAVYEIYCGFRSA